MNLASLLSVVLVGQGADRPMIVEGGDTLFFVLH